MNALSESVAGAPAQRQLPHTPTGVHHRSDMSDLSCDLGTLRSHAGVFPACSRHPCGNAPPQAHSASPNCPLPVLLGAFVKNLSPWHKAAPEHGIRGCSAQRWICMADQTPALWNSQVYRPSLATWPAAETRLQVCPAVDDVDRLCCTALRFTDCSVQDLCHLNVSPDWHRWHA